MTAPDMTAVEVGALRSSGPAMLIRRERLVAVLRRIEPRDRLLGLVEELADAGVRVFEVTFDAASAEADLGAIRERLAGRGDGPFACGAGTVLARSQLDGAIRVGAEFAVSPLFDRELLAAAVAANLPFVPGAFTPTEIRAAWEAGATFVKLFPASAVGPSFVRELRGPLPDIEILPTGGIGAANAAAFLEAGAVAVGVGGALSGGSPADRAAILAAVRAAARRPDDRARMAAGQGAR